MFHHRCLVSMARPTLILKMFRFGGRVRASQLVRGTREHHEDGSGKQNVSSRPVSLAGSPARTGKVFLRRWR